MKIFKPYESKTLQLKVDDIDSNTRKVKFAISAFDVLDSDRDIIRKGAFLKSINERGPQSGVPNTIQHLRNHDWSWQIGKLVELYETSEYLIGVSQLGRSTKGNDALLDYEDGIINQHSIGFNYISDKMKYIEGGEYWEIAEVKLYEGSAVAFGANPITPTLDIIKGITKESLVEKLNNEMNVLIKSLSNGKGTDDRLYNLEMQLKVLQTKYNSLILLEPSVKDTLKLDKPDNEVKNFYLKMLNVK